MQENNRTGAPGVEQCRKTTGLEHQELSNAGEQQNWSTRSGAMQENNRTGAPGVEQCRRTTELEHQELSNAGEQQNWSTRS